MTNLGTASVLVESAMLCPQYSPAHNACPNPQPLFLYAGQQGAAIYLNSTAPTCQRINECAFDISQSNFEDNTGVAGGAIDMTADSLAVHVKDSNFTRNRAQSSYAGGLNLDQPAYLPRNANRCALKVYVKP